MYVDKCAGMYLPDFNASNAQHKNEVAKSCGSLDRRLVRAARHLLGWNQRRLAAESGIGIATVRRYEGGSTMRVDTVQAMMAALQRARIAFVDGQDPSHGIETGIHLLRSKSFGRTTEADD